jgi:hypothetical protein
MELKQDIEFFEELLLSPVEVGSYKIGIDGGMYMKGGQFYFSPTPARLTSPKKNRIDPSLL